MSLIKKIPLCFFFVSILLLASCSFKNKEQARVLPELLQGEKVLNELNNFLQISPREAGTPQAAKAARYILTKLNSYGINDAEIDYFEDKTPADVIGLRNVIGKIKGGKEQTIIFASHYDTKAGISTNFQGANDSGSSTALLLELSRIFAEHYKNLYNKKPKLWQYMPSVIFVFFFCEECKVEYGPNDGLHGSCRMVEVLSKANQLTYVIAFVLLDMVGDKNLKVEIPPNTSGKLMKLTFDAANKVGTRKYFTIGKVPILDDHVPFLHAGIPAVVLIDFHYGSSPELNDYWHTTNDTIDKISANSLEVVGKTTIELFNRIIAEEFFVEK